MTRWDAADYAMHSQGQFAWAMAVIDRLSLPDDASVLDIGCGDGKITVELARRVSKGRVVGIDSSLEMIAQARRTWTSVPNVEFHVMDAQAITFDGPFDLAYSNSTLHWVPDHAAVLRGVARALKPGGRIAFSMGGRGTAAGVYAALDVMSCDSRWSPYLSGAKPPHHYGSPEQYAGWLPAAALTPTRIALVPKPMQHADRVALEGWVRTVWTPYTERIPATERARFVAELTERVHAQCAFDDTGAILMPMVNLEVEAEKMGHNMK